MPQQLYEHDAPPRQPPCAQAVVALRPEMLRFARSQLRDKDSAEDLVQDSIEAALLGKAPFAGQSSLKTWVFSILRHHLLDHMRRSSRHVSLASLAAQDGEWEPVELALSQPLAMDPERALGNVELRQALEIGLQGLPESARQVIVLREVLGHETQEICDRLSLTRTNCHVILHRAKARLRELLQDQWGTSCEAIH